jgi:hypothetical protein
MTAVLKKDWVIKLFSIVFLCVFGVGSLHFLFEVFNFSNTTYRIILSIVVVFVALFVSGAILSPDDRKAIKGDVADAIDAVGKLFRTVGECFLVLLVIALGFGALWLLIRIIHWMWEKPLPTS